MNKEIDTLSYLKPRDILLPEQLKSLNEIYVEQLFETNAVIVKGVDEEPFKLRSGSESFLYVDHARIASSYLGFSALLAAVHGEVAKQFDGDYAVMNVGSKISPQMCGGYVRDFGVNQIVFKDKKLLVTEKGTMQNVTGFSKRLAILDDVGTSGRTIIEAKNAAVESGLMPDELHAFVGLVREPNDFQDNLKAEGIEAHWAITLDEVLENNLDKFSDAQRESIKQERGIG